MHQAVFWAIGAGCAVAMVVPWKFVAARVLALDPIQEKLARGITEASAQGLTQPAIIGFWRAINELLDRRGIRGLPARRGRMIHALRMCRERLSANEFEGARRMLREIYVDI